MSGAIDLAVLSDDAKAIAGVWFGMMRPGKGSVTHHLRELKPTDRTQAALDELVAKGVISVEPFNRFGGLVYRPLMDCHAAFAWFGKLRDTPAMEAVNWRLMEPVPAAESLGFVNRAEGGHGRMSIKKSHRAEGRNFVD